MEIDANMKWGSVNGLPANNRPAAAGSQAPGSPLESFANSSALEGALNNTPDVRPEAVANGQALANDPGYPSGDTLKQLSGFLANHLQGLD
jgi:hypothetical protein